MMKAGLYLIKLCAGTIPGAADTSTCTCVPDRVHNLDGTIYGDQAANCSMRSSSEEACVTEGRYCDWECTVTTLAPVTAAPEDPSCVDTHADCEQSVAMIGCNNVALNLEATCPKTCNACPTAASTAVTTAAATTVSPVPDSKVFDRQCRPCLTADGLYSVETNAQNCTASVPCGPGSYIQIPAPTGRHGITAVGPHACGPCTEGFFTDTTNAPACTPYTQCGLGAKYEAVAPTASNDRVCALCPDGSTASIPNSQTGACRKCPPGTAATDTTSLEGHSRACVTCQIGITFLPSYGGTQCIPAKTCLPGTRQTTAPTARSDRECADCVQGTSWQDRSNQEQCNAVTVCQQPLWIRVRIIIRI